MRLFFVTVIVSMALVLSRAEAQNYKIYQAIKTTAPIVSDGILDEKDWQDPAKTGDFHSNREVGGTPARQQTCFRMLYDESNLYFAVECEEPQMAELVVNHFRHGEAVEKDDSITIWINPGRVQGKCFGFTVNARGVSREEIGGQAEATNLAWEVRVEQSAAGWVVEAAIPFETLGIGPNTGASWGLNMFRRHYAGGFVEKSAWSGIGNEGVEDFGHLTFVKEKAGRSNLLVNGDFETNTFWHSWEWGPFQKTKRRNYEGRYDAEVKYMGNRSVYVRHIGEDYGECAWYTDSITNFDRAAKYMFTVYVKSAGGGGGKVQVLYNDRAQTVYNMAGGDTDWRPFHCVITPPEDAKSIRIYLKNCGDGTYWFDDASLVVCDAENNSLQKSLRPYYQKEYAKIRSENLEALEKCGDKELEVKFSALDDKLRRILESGQMEDDIAVFEAIQKLLDECREIKIMARKVRLKLLL